MLTTSILLWMLGTTEIIIIAIVILLLFGGRKIPELLKGLGKGIRDFKNASKGIHDEKDILIEKNNLKD